jgi:hypothetical protein
MSLQPEAEWQVEITDEGLVCTDLVGQRRTLTWGDLESVIIRTNDSGPFAMDVWWHLRGRAENGALIECEVPMGATGEKIMLERLQQLPDFDNDAVINAMMSVDDAEFVCWTRGDEKA